MSLTTQRLIVTAVALMFLVVYWRVEIDFFGYVKDKVLAVIPGLQRQKFSATFGTLFIAKPGEATGFWAVNGSGNNARLFSVRIASTLQLVNESDEPIAINSLHVEMKADEGKWEVLPAINFGPLYFGNNLNDVSMVSTTIPRIYDALLGKNLPPKETISGALFVHWPEGWPKILPAMSIEPQFRVRIKDSRGRIFLAMVDRPVREEAGGISTNGLGLVVGGALPHHIDISTIPLQGTSP